MPSFRREGAKRLANPELRFNLKDGPGHDIVENNCATCHNLGYIETNSPFPDAKLWTAEVNKMIKTYGAPIAPDDAKIIIEYLVTNYGAQAPVGSPPSGPAADTPTETGIPEAPRASIVRRLAKRAGRHGRSGGDSN